MVLSLAPSEFLTEKALIFRLLSRILLASLLAATAFVASSRAVVCNYYLDTFESNAEPKSGAGKTSTTALREALLPVLAFADGEFAVTPNTARPVPTILFQIATATLTQEMDQSALNIRYPMRAPIRSLCRRLEERWPLSFKIRQRIN
jgi:hypothetical protein